MGILVRCDVCGKLYEVDNLQKFVVAQGETVLVEGFVCDDCASNIVDYIKEQVEKHQSAEAAEVAGEEETKEKK